MFVQGQGSGDLALCGQTLPEDGRRGTPRTINEPLGDECKACRIASGHLKRPPRRKPTEDERKAIAFYTGIVKTGECLIRLGMSPSDAASALKNFLAERSKPL
jgi:hypothetical protein